MAVLFYNIYSYPSIKDSYGKSREFKSSSYRRFRCVPFQPVGSSNVFSSHFSAKNLILALGLLENQTWPLTAKIIVRLTIGAWCATFISSVARASYWFKAMNAEHGAIEHNKIKADVTRVQTFFLWVLGIMTALSTYVIQWFISTGLSD